MNVGPGELEDSKTDLHIPAVILLSVCRKNASFNSRDKFEGFRCHCYMADISRMVLWT